MTCKDDSWTWNNCKLEDIWIFDKLILSKKLGYICGPAGVDVPTPGNYIIRPITNILGMGRKASFSFIEKTTDDLEPGMFWCEIFTGHHYSVDYRDEEQILCVEGIRNKEDPLYKWKEWKRVATSIPYPSILRTLQGRYETINVEFIGEKIIEVHLRGNMDFINNSAKIIPVWRGENRTPPDNMVFIENKDYEREGFFYDQK